MSQEQPLQDTFDTIRIPVVGEETNSAITTRHTGLTGSPSQTPIYINAIPVDYINKSTGLKETWLESRQGMQAATIDLTGKVNDVDAVVPLAALTMTTIQCHIIAFLDESNNTIYIVKYHGGSTGPIQIGSFTNAASEIGLSELVVAGVPTLGVTQYDIDGLVNGRGWFATSASGDFSASSLTLISDGQFPPNLGTPDPIKGCFVQMNGTTYIMGHSGKIYNSDLNSISSWNALGVIEAVSYPDRGVGLARYKHHIVAFGQYSIEFFNDVGTAAPASPLQRTDQAFIKMGVTTAKSFINYEDNLYFINNEPQNVTSLWKLDGYTPVRISFVGEVPILQNLYPHLQILILNGLPHLCTNIRQTFYTVPNSLMTGDDDHPFIVPLRGLLCFNLRNLIPWYFAYEMDVFLSGSLLVSLISDGKILNGAPYQYIWHHLSVNDAEPNKYNQNPISMDANDVYTFHYDKLLAHVPSNTITTRTKIPFYFNTQWMDFGNERRKRIHKLKLIATHYDLGFWDGSTDQPFVTWNSDNNYLYFFWTKSDTLSNWVNSASVVSTTPIRVRSIDIAPGTNTSRRYYIANCGTNRFWTLGFAAKLYLPLRVKAIEIDISQGL